MRIRFLHLENGLFKLSATEKDDSTEVVYSAQEYWDSESHTVKVTFSTNEIGKEVSESVKKRILDRLAFEYKEF